MGTENAKSLKIDFRAFQGKPALWLKLYIWIACQIDGADRIVTTIDDMRQAMAHKVGYRTETPSGRQIRRAYDGLSALGLISTTRGSHSLKITLRPYD